MTEPQERVYWRLWAAACSAQGWGLLGNSEKNQYRYAVHALACGNRVVEGEQPVQISSKKLTNAQITRVFNILKRLVGESFHEVAEDQTAMDPSLERRTEMVTAISRMAEMTLWIRDPRLCGIEERRTLADEYLAAIARDLGLMTEWRRLPLELKTHQDMTNLYQIIKARLREAIKEGRDTRGNILRTRPDEAIDHIIQRVIRYGVWAPYATRVALEPSDSPANQTSAQAVPV